MNHHCYTAKSRVWVLPPSVPGENRKTSLEVERESFHKTLKHFAGLVSPTFGKLGEHRNPQWSAGLRLADCVKAIHAFLIGFQLVANHNVNRGNLCIGDDPRYMVAKGPAEADAKDFVALEHGVGFVGRTAFDATGLPFHCMPSEFEFQAPTAGVEPAPIKLEFRCSDH